MSEKWTLAEGIEHLFAEDENGDLEIGDLMTEKEHPIPLEISLAVVTVNLKLSKAERELKGVEEEPTTGISVILTSNNLAGDEGEEHCFFSQTLFPHNGETLPELAKRIAIGLEVKPDERIWEDGN